VDVEKGTVILGPRARDALGARVAEAHLGALPDELVAPATIVTPWQGHAHVSSRLGGKVVALHVRPGQRLEAGQLVAEVESLELTDLQRELLDAQNDTELAKKNLTMLEDSARRGAASQSAVELARTLHEQHRNSLDIHRR